MKYYIPISCLNLDNILQSESISPIPFYVRRKTGYDSFDVLPEFRGVNQIVLFEYPVQFSVNDPNRNNYPVLIEIEDEQQLCYDAIQHYENGVYLYNKTLYITPYNCRIFFFSERAYKLTTINTKDDKSIKHYNKYRIYPTVEKLGNLKNMPIVKPLSNQIFGENLETKNDKKKGVLYAYLIGQSLSLTPKLARQKYLTQEIYNTYAGINAYIKTNDSIPNTYIEKLTEQLEEYKKIDEIERNNQLSINKYIKRYTDQRGIEIENFMECLKLVSKNALNCMYREISSKCRVPILPSVSELHSGNDYTDLIEQVESHTAQSIASYKNEMPKFSLTTVTVDDKSISIKGKELLNIAINYIIDNEITQDTLSANRAKICSEIIQQIQNYFITTLGYSEEQWNKDTHRQYALHLYNSIKDHRSSFLLNNATELKYGVEFMAIAAFIWRGDGIDGYLKYLLKNEVADYSMPLALWGALCGYMEMNRDFLSEFLTEEIYDNVYEHINGVKPYKANFNDDQPPCQPKSEGFVRTDDFLFVVEQAQIADIYRALKSDVNGEYVDHQILDRILEANKRKKKQCNTARNIFYHIKCKEYNKLEKLIPAKKHWSAVAEHFGIQVATSNKTKRTIKNKGCQGSQDHGLNDSTLTPNLFTNDNQSAKSCDVTGSKVSPLMDNSWIEKCASIILDTKSQRQFIEDMDWWVKDKRMKYEGLADNVVLEKLCQYISKRSQYKEPDKQWIVKIYCKIPIDKILSYMRQKYGNR